jgi:hypothetical protein
MQPLATIIIHAQTKRVWKKEGSINYGLDEIGRSRVLLPRYREILRLLLQ